MLTSLIPALCRRTRDDETLRTAHALLAASDGRQAFIARARMLRVLGLTLTHLERDGVLAALPGDAASELRAPLSRIRRAVGAQELERERVSGRLRAAGIDPVLLKGAALRSAYYDAPEEREAADLDLLVPADAWSAAYEAFVAAGYAPLDAHVIASYRARHFHLRLEHALGGIVEVHWALAEPDAPYRLDAEAVRRDAVRVERRGRPAARMPRAEHLLLHVAAQSAHDGFAIFSRLVDADRIIARSPSLDWAFLLDAARRGGLETAVSLTLELAHAMLGTTIADDVRARFRPRALTRWHVRLLRPERRVVAPDDPRRDVTERLMQLWVLRGERSWLSRVRAVLAQDVDSPVLHSRDSAALRVRASTAVAALKLGAFQLSLYLAANGAAPRSAATSARPWSPRER